MFEVKTRCLPKEDPRTTEFCADQAFGEEVTNIENPCEDNLSTDHFAGPSCSLCLTACTKTPVSRTVTAAITSTNAVTAPRIPYN